MPAATSATLEAPRRRVSKRLAPTLENEMIRVGDVAALLNVSPGAVLGYEARALMPKAAGSIAGRRFWKRGTIESWIAAGCPPRGD